MIHRFLVFKDATSTKDIQGQTAGHQITSKARVHGHQHVTAVTCKADTQSTCSQSSQRIVHVQSATRVNRDNGH